MLVVVQVQARTNLVTPMAIDCAQTAGFNLELALAKFQELQVSFTQQVSCPCSFVVDTASDPCALLPGTWSLTEVAVSGRIFTLA